MTRGWVVALAAAGLLTGCAGSSGVASPSGTPSGTPSTTVVGPVVPSPSVTGVPAPAGSLVTASIPLATRTAHADVYFGGLPVDKDPQGERTVVYPAAEVQFDDSGHIVVHLKLPVFTCPTYGDLHRIKRTACTGRTVSYADADERSTTITRDKGGAFVADVVAATYRYGRGEDRTPKQQPVATGETVSLRLRIRPGALVARIGTATTFRAKGYVQRPGAPGVATEDDSYENRLVRRAP